MGSEKKGNIEDLRKEYGINKIIPPQFEHAALLALSHYPELKNIYVEFLITKKALFPYSSRPRVTDIFSDPEKRRYQIIIAAQSKVLEKILLNNLPFKAQVGILGHELAHTALYLRQHANGLLKTGLFYFLPSFRERFEKDTDRAAIAHGLGKELLEYSTYIRTIEGLLKNNPWMDKYYLRPDEITRSMTSLNQVNR
ncbi:MAG TPA: hypothetical protein VF691_13640 [Cytophagaceae bacterium]|jgi:hypothetical protein